ncbi:response regulator [Arcobacter sp. FWKO B]|uniref:response regulator n=1 Tax=Arcobacter sp. FWKO B TaxID=2593672 RepID=UPI0018A3AAEF|nr:response regulator [Arcobacter sp. FWKO B]QOG11655.1 response regulator [Arcobacter sp. FWKO B]
MLKNSKILNDLRTIKLLIVEDGEDIIKIMDNTFKSLVKEIYLAYNPKDGLELYHKVQPDIILTDIRMPRAHDGNDFIKNIRELNKNIPIIVVSAYSHDLANKELVNFVMDKPIDFEKLIHLIDEALFTATKE